MQHHPLIVPGHQLSCLGEELVGSRRIGAGREHVDDLVVKFQECKVRLCDQQILIIAMVSDQRAAFRTPRQIIGEDYRAARGVGAVLPSKNFGPGCVMLLVSRA